MNDDDYEGLMVSIGLLRPMRQLSFGSDLWKMRCPYHEERTPSLVLNAGRRTFHCFGCGKHGTPEELLTKLRG